MATQFWAPWTPSIGQQVRIRRSAECPHQHDWTHADKYPDGAVGEVYDLFGRIFNGAETSDGHDVMVLFDEDDEGRMDCGWFAAIELEPVATQAPTEQQQAAGAGERVG